MLSVEEIQNIKFWGEFNIDFGFNFKHLQVFKIE